MNAVEIEAEVSALAAKPFDALEFPFAFLQAFGTKETTIKRLRKGDTNASDVPGGVLQRGNIHIAVCDAGRVNEKLRALRASPRTAAARVKFLLATDGETLEAEDCANGDTIASGFTDLAGHLGFFLPLAGISTVKEIKENPIDVRATGRLNKLYVELLKENAEWATDARRHDMNHFMARLIFCFFAEDTDIFRGGGGLFTETVRQMSERDGSNTDYVIGMLFRGMNTKLTERAAAKLPPWADGFPYVNGELFSGSTDVPRFTKMARTYLLHAGELSWRQINPDIFGSMIQAVAEEEERGALGMHYTSVPNILKVLNPLFLDELRGQLEAAGENARSLGNLRKRMAKIRVFDPACGSGNFLVIAYKQMREIEAEVNRRLGEPDARTKIPLTNFRGIEIRDFPAEIARLALIIAEFQCDVLYRGEKLALGEFLPLDASNWITCGNALRLDWLSVCPPTGSGVKLAGDDLFSTPLEQAQIDFENEGAETYVCGNPPYVGSTWQSSEQKSDLAAIFGGRSKDWRSLDYVSGWFMKAADYGTWTSSTAAFVSTNSICQGQQVPILWPLIFKTGHEIAFAHTSFKWANLASKNAGVTVIIVGISGQMDQPRMLFSTNEDDTVRVGVVNNINAYLVPASNLIVQKADKPISALDAMYFGSKPVDDGALLLERNEIETLRLPRQLLYKYIRRVFGSAEFINGAERYCIWLPDDEFDTAAKHQELNKRFDRVRLFRLSSTKAATVNAAKYCYKFAETRQTGNETVIVVPSVSSENRHHLPTGLMPRATIITNLAFALYDAPLWNMALIASRIHLVWIATVCGKLETRYRYSNTLGWNTFPVPTLTEQNKSDLTQCAEDILLAREAHFPATIADLYEPDKMPENLRRAHDRNDEMLERIYIGRRFRNDTERLEKLFELYTKMTATTTAAGSSGKKKKKNTVQ